MGENPYESPSALNAASVTTDLDGQRIKDHLLQIASAQRFLCLVILAALLVTVGLIVAASRQLPLGLIATPIQLVLSVLQVIAVYRLAQSVYRSSLVGFLMALLAFIPCLGLLVMLVANGKATAELQRYGYRVGLLGASLDQFSAEHPLPDHNVRR